MPTPEQRVARIRSGKQIDRTSMKTEKLSIKDVADAVTEAGADEMVLVKLSGREYARPQELADVYGVSKYTIIAMVDRIAESHQMRTLDIGERTRVINLLDFRRGLIDIATTQQGYTRRGV